MNKQKPDSMWGTIIVLVILAAGMVGASPVMAAIMGLLAALLTTIQLLGYVAQGVNAGVNALTSKKGE